MFSWAMPDQSVPVSLWGIFWPNQYPKCLSTPFLIFFIILCGFKSAVSITSLLSLFGPVQILPGFHQSTGFAMFLSDLCYGVPGQYPVKRSVLRVSLHPPRWYRLCRALVCIFNLQKTLPDQFCRLKYLGLVLSCFFFLGFYGGLLRGSVICLILFQTIPTQHSGRVTQSKSFLGLPYLSGCQGQTLSLARLFFHLALELRKPFPLKISEWMPACKAGEQS